ncbi:MAG: hypothetical protein K9M10_01260 [Candidatus Pacebacteria bacterium]|nr:hypothetical protein [Candidatus Paceibacterota bacterium]MCF7857091.1 hypothetical protein [Candidatus Paceibacterota bacterium]
MSQMAFAYDSPWEKTLAYPPTLTGEELALAETELLPENVEKTKIALASDYGQKFDDTLNEASPYVEIVMKTRRGKDPANSLNDVSAYVEFPLTATLSLWVTGTDDETFKGTYVGLARKFGNWQVALGGGSVVYGDTRHNVINPWILYSTDSYEAYLHAEYYGKESDNRWWYKAFADKKFGNTSFGLYGEAGVGIGPRLSWQVTKNLKFWVMVPVALQPNEGKIKFMAAAVVMF